MSEDIYTEAGEEFDRRLEEHAPTLSRLIDDDTRSRYRVWFRSGARWAEYRLGGSAMQAFHMSLGITIGVLAGWVFYSDWIKEVPLSPLWIGIAAFALTAWAPPRLVKLSRRFVDWRVERATRPRA